MYVCLPEIMKCWFFFLFLSPTMCIFQVFLMVAWEKQQKMLIFFGVGMYVRPKLTFVSFFMFFFFAPSPK